MEEVNISWSLPAYEHREKSNDWFWALGIIVVAGALASLIFGNFFFAMILVLAGGMMWYFAQKHPEVVDYELNEKGLRVKNELFPYESLKSFFVAAEPNPTLFVRSSRFFMPILSIPIEPELVEEIRGVMLSQKVKEEQMKEHISEHIMNAIGF